MFICRYDHCVVQSAKDRRSEEVKMACDETCNKMKNNDWTSIQTVFDKLNPKLEKTMKVTWLRDGSPTPQILSVGTRWKDVERDTV